MGGGGGIGNFNGTKGSDITISDKKMYQVGDHFNKHGREMGYNSKKEYEAGAREFVETNKNNPKAEVTKGEWNGTNDPDKVNQIAVSFNGLTVIINAKTGQIIDFYKGTEHRGFINIKPFR